MGEENTLFRQRVEARRFGVATHGAESAKVPVVGVQQNNVHGRLLFLCRGGCCGWCLSIFVILAIFPTEDAVFQVLEIVRKWIAEGCKGEGRQDKEDNSKSKQASGASLRFEAFHMTHYLLCCCAVT